MRHLCFGSKCAEVFVNIGKDRDLSWMLVLKFIWLKYAHPLKIPNSKKKQFKIFATVAKQLNLNVLKILPKLAKLTQIG